MCCAQRVYSPAGTCVSADHQGIGVGHERRGLIGAEPPDGICHRLDGLTDDAVVQEGDARR